MVIKFKIKFKDKEYFVTVDTPKDRVTIYMAHLIFANQLIDPLQKRHFESEHMWKLAGAITKANKEELNSIKVLSINEIMPEQNKIKFKSN